MSVRHPPPLSGPRPWALAAALVAGLAAPAAQAHPSVSLAPHKGLYVMSMISTSGTTVAHVEGQMLYEAADTCDAWITDQRFNLTYLYTAGPEARIVSQYSSWEAKDGQTYRFTSSRTQDGKVVEEFRGEARRTAGETTGTATFSKPKALDLTLPAGFLFPTQHTVELLRRAQAGQAFFNASIFDGNDEEGTVEINAFVAPAALGTLPGALSQAAPDVRALVTGPARRVQMAFFPADRAEPTPEYTMDVEMMENGVITAMTIAYSDFTIRGTLTGLETLPAPVCPASSVPVPTPAPAPAPRP